MAELGSRTSASLRAEQDEREIARKHHEVIPPFGEAFPGGMATAWGGPSRGRVGRPFPSRGLRHRTLPTGRSYHAESDMGPLQADMGPLHGEALRVILRVITRSSV